MFKVISCLLVAAFGLGARAEDGEVLSLKPKFEAGTAAKPLGFWPLVGIETGFMSSSPDARTGGVPTQIKVLGSYYFDGAPLVVDLGAGLHNETLTQRGPGSNATQAFYSELATRYSFDDRWQIGAVWSTLVDNGRTYQSTNDNLASFVGAQALKEFNYDENYVIRLGGRAMTSVGFNGGSVNTVMAELEVSFGPSGTKPPQIFATNTPRAARQSENTDSAKLAHALAGHRGLFGKVVVVGYFADPAHKLLAKHRSHSVARKLADAGIDPKQIVEEQRGREAWLSPRGSPSALLLDERVRVEFEDVRSDADLSGVLNSAAL